MSDRIGCHTVEIDGQPVTVRGPGHPTVEDIAHLTEIVRAAKGVTDRDHPHYGVIQELLAAVRLATYCIPDGPVHASIAGERDGGEVKTRLKRASLAARFALDPAYEAKVAARLVEQRRATENECPRIWRHEDPNNPPRITPHQAATTGVGLRNKQGKVWRWHDGGWRLKPRTEGQSRGATYGFHALVEHFGPLTEIPALPEEAADG